MCAAALGVRNEEHGVIEAKPRDLAYRAAEKAFRERAIGDRASSVVPHEPIDLVRRQRAEAAAVAAARGGVSIGVAQGQPQKTRRHLGGILGIPPVPPGAGRDSVCAIARRKASGAFSGTGAFFGH
jgi:hypothetical protein